MKDLILGEIERTVAGHPRHRMWRDPLVACADAGDPLFVRLREVAHQGHLQPSDLLDGARTVITYFMAFSPDTIRGNTAGRFQSPGWALAYIETNELIVSINTGLTSLLVSRGYRAAAISPTHTFDRGTLLSAWSHRHAAYIAGLGTFGLNRMLITEHGCCGRIGSLVTDAVIQADERPGREYCSFKVDGSCGACVKRCPSGALCSGGFDRHACYEALLDNERRFVHLGKADACGKCLCGLPCSESIPRPAHPRPGPV